MKRIQSWIEAMRLRTLPVSAAGVLTAVGFNIADGTFEAVPAALCLIFALLCQIASNFANEYYDYRAGRDRAGREGPRRGVTEGDITPEAMRRATFATLIIAAVTGLALVLWGGWWLVAVGAVVAVGALAYSTGPFPLSTHCLGEVAVFVFFGLVPVCFTYYVQALEFTAPVTAAAAAIGLMGANVLIVNNYRDIHDDMAVGKHTLATAMGARAMPLLYIADALVATALMLPSWLRLPTGWLAVPLLYMICALVIALRMSRLRGAALTPMLGMTAVAMFVYSLMFLIANICLYAL